MNVLNIHERVINRPIEEVAALIETLSSENDMVWPKEKWPKMKFKDGLVIGAKGGHGPIGYTIDKMESNKLIRFKFSKPKGFHGWHGFKLTDHQNGKTGIQHTIKMNTKGVATIMWLVAIRWLHDALAEDALDKIENRFSDEEKSTNWSIWVKILRGLLK